ncbi:hypothetical protein ACOCJ5_11115 [Knoellia sp. CPCC 206450]|uniref:hypothetical protein n=1 Tax=Knoellia tibetensis TaxID=3404798 RepID=UPI003B43A122
MQPSSLIFLVIIGIWAAYFVQYWVRRREHLATIRSVDAFSETMRVLERRSPLPSVDTGSQAPRTYAVSPARAMRPQVTVKRAEAHTMSRVEVSAARPTVSSASAASPTSSSASTSAASRVVEAEIAPMHPSRAVRGISLLAGLLGTVVVSVLAVLGVVVAWAPLLSLALALGSFAWLRAGVQSEIRAKQELRRESRLQARRDATRRTTVSTRTTEAAPASAPSARRSAPVVETEVLVNASTDDAGPVDAADDVTVDAAPFDVSAEVPAELQPVSATSVPEPATPEPAAQTTPALPEVDEDDIPLTWDPRPVPPPTYTMKARAPERPLPAAQVEPVAEAEDTAYDALPERRISGL